MLAKNKLSNISIQRRETIVCKVCRLDTVNMTLHRNPKEIKTGATRKHVQFECQHEIVGQLGQETRLRVVTTIALMISTLKYYNRAQPIKSR